MTLHTLAQQQRRELLDREQAIANQIDSAYGGMWRSLVHRLFKLLSDMQRAEAQAQAAGVPFHAMLWIRQFRRLDTLLQSVQLDLQSFVQTAQQLVQSGLPAAYHAGVQDALRLLEASLDNRIGIAFGRPSARALEILAGRGASHEKVAKLFSRLTPDAKDAVRKRLLAGLALGENPRAVARSVEQGVRIARNGALTIARNEMIGAYRTAAIEAYRANSDILRGWTWSAAETACDFCRGRNGSHHLLSETLESHVNCRCAMLPDTISYDEMLARFAA